MFHRNLIVVRLNSIENLELVWQLYECKQFILKNNYIAFFP